MARFENPQPQFILQDGSLAAGGTLDFFVTGTNTRLPIFADVNATIPIENPVTLGSRGEVPDVFFSTSARCVLTDVDGNQIFDLDPVGGNAAGGAFEVWDSNIVYEQNDIVFGPDGNPYISLVNENQGNDPSLNPGDNPFWSELASFQVWNAQFAYGPNDIALQEGVLYRSLISANLGNNPSQDDGTQWRSIADATFVTYNNTSSGLMATTGQEAFDEIVNIINNLPSSVVFRGNLDVSGGDASLPPNPANGDLYVIAVGGIITVSVGGAAPTPTQVNPGEQIIFNGTTGNFELIAAVQQAASVSYNNTTSGLVTTNVQDAIDETEGRLDTTEQNVNDNETAINVLDGRIDSLETFEANAGTAFTANVQTGSLDTTFGVLMAVGAFGLGATQQSVWPNTSLNNVSGVATGIYGVVGSTTDTPDGTNTWVVYFQTRIRSDIQSSQFAIRSGDLSNPEMYHRSSAGGTETAPIWSAWTRLLNEGDGGLLGQAQGGIFAGDLDTLTTGQLSVAIDPTATNTPVVAFGILTVMPWTDATAGAQRFQTLEGASGSRVFHRSRDSGVWRDWVEQFDSGNSVNPLSFGLGGPSAVVPGNNLNNITVGGLYGVVSTTLNTPPLFQSANPSQSGVLVITFDANDQQQVFFSRTTDQMFVRRQVNGVFSDWVEYFNENRPNAVGFGLTAASLVSRQAAVTYINRLAGASFTTSLDGSYLTNDVVILNKGAIPGTWSVSSPSIGFVYPDGSVDALLTIPNGVCTSVNLHRRGDALWQVTILG